MKKHLSSLCHHSKCNFIGPGCIEWYRNAPTGWPLTSWCHPCLVQEVGRLQQRLLNAGVGLLPGDALWQRPDATKRQDAR